ncbi:MAG TPA: exodeoxyribonuclease VII large subunit [Oligoflexia bacterium]|mgnify:CR=1 FL=1|nr:exodeoxyribonuclease VII large subunit [Oligoflexia bacterium]
MSVLRVKVNRREETAVFTGPGTYAARETIKKLGSARFIGPEKKWEVRSFKLSLTELKEILPHAVIEEEDADADSGLVSTEINFNRETRENLPGSIVLPQSFSVSELIARAREALRAAFPGRVFVRGVLSAVKENKGGRLFVDLVEAERPDESISCVIWNNAELVCQPLIDAGFKLEQGLQVMFEVQVDVSRRRANIMLSILGVVAEYTLGKIAAQRDLTNERLKKDGLFSKNKSLTLPFLPHRLGILTSGGGTVINDFRASLDAAKFGFELLWVNVSVQGAAAKREILNGLRLLRQQELDAILIFRGGGSPADLAVFNDYDIAQAVCRSPRPVIAAIGHEEDHTSVQDVSFLAFGVPKDIGHYFANLIVEQRRSFGMFVDTITRTAGQLACARRQRLLDFSRSLCALAQQVYTTAAGNLDQRSRMLPQIGAAQLNSAAQLLIARSAPVVPLAAQNVVFVQNSVVQTVALSLGRLRALLSKHLLQLCASVQRLHLNGLRKLESAEGAAAVCFRLKGAFELAIAQGETALLHQEKLLASSAPEVQLHRGFSLVRSGKDGKYIVSGKHLVENDPVDIKFYDCTRQAIIKR